MKTLTLSITIVLLLLSGAIMAQEKEEKFPELQKEIREAKLTRVIKALNLKKQAIINEEKELLKDEVEAINERLFNDEISENEADRLKREAAENRAKNIDNRVTIIDNLLALIERNGPEGWDAETGELSYIELGLGVPNENGDRLFGVEIKRRENREKVDKHSLRTQGSLTFAVGLNNAIIDGQSIDDSPYKIGGSRFAELGYSWSTRVFDDSNWLRFRYGFSFQFNGLKPDDNRVFLDNGSDTVLEEFPVKLDKSKFRMDNLVIPVHFEIGPSNRKEKDGNVTFNTHNKFKIGFGGYAGLNLGTRQKLKFENEDGERIKQKLKANYNTNNLIYGLSGYIGWDTVSLYAKYDLNPIFKGAGPEQRNVSLGVRWDFD